MHTALYLAYLTQTANTPSPVEEAVKAQSWVHRMATVEDVTAHPLVVQVLAGAKWILADKTSIKELLTLEQLHAFVEKFGSENATLADIRALTFYLLAFAGFFRFDEMEKFRLCDIAIHVDHMEQFFESSKTHQLRQGAIARTDTRLCSVAMLQRYMRMANIVLDGSEQFLFRGITHTTKSCKLSEKSTCESSYTTITVAVLQKIEAIGLDK